MWLQLQLHLVVFTKHRVSYIYIYNSKDKSVENILILLVLSEDKIQNIWQKENSEVECKKSGTVFLKVEILKGIIMRDKALLPRISFGLSETLQLPFVLIRKHLRRVRTFAMSVNKSQGQIFKHDLFLRVFFFSQMVVCYHVTFQKW